MEAFACKWGIKINDIPALKQCNSQQTKSENAALKCRAHFLQLFSAVQVKLLLIYGRVEKWCSQGKGDEGNCLKNPGNFFSFQDSRWDWSRIRFNSIAAFIGVLCAIFTLNKWNILYFLLALGVDTSCKPIEAPGLCYGIYRWGWRAIATG